MPCFTRTPKLKHYAFCLVKCEPVTGLALGVGHIG